jgi:CP family cyanate transporter-like MFS transporter
VIAPTRTGAASVLAGMFLVGVALRPPLVAIGSLGTTIRSDLGISHALLGALAAIPVACMGLFAGLGPRVTRARGWYRPIGAGLALLAVASLVRAVVPDVTAVLLATIPIGIAIAVIGVVLPVMVKDRFPERPAFATAIYASGIQVGAVAGAAAAVPLAHATGGWRGALIVFAALTAAIVPAYLVLAAGGVRWRPSTAARPRLPLHSALAWTLVGVFCLHSILYYGLTAWLPSFMVDRGWTAERGGALLGLVNLTAIPIGLLVPWLADRMGSRRRYLLACSGTMTLATVGLVALPGAAWGFGVAFGCGMGAAFSLMLTLPLDVSATPATAGAMAAMMLGGGYVLSAVAPVGLGVLRDATGDYALGMWLLVAAGVVSFALFSTLSPERLARGVVPGRRPEEIPA